MIKLLNVTYLYQLLCSPHVDSSLLQITTGIQFQCKFSRPNVHLGATKLFLTYCTS